MRPVPSILPDRDGSWPGRSGGIITTPPFEPVTCRPYTGHRSQMIADATESLSRWWAPAVAFTAGIVSFASPCVFPLVPGSLSFVTGESIAGIDREPPSTVSTRTRNLLPILLFIAGFTLVFPLYGPSSTAFGRIFKGRTGQVIAGLVVIAVGLLLVGYALGRGWLALYAGGRPV